MFQWERKFWTWICNHVLILSVIAATVISLIIRYTMRDFLTEDMTWCFLPWYDVIKRLGGMDAMGTSVGNYSMTYQTLMAIFTYFPLKPEYTYKISSGIFDFLQAIYIAWIVYDYSEDITKSAISYAIAINLPIVLMNSALWGQCDSIYTSFCLLSCHLMLKDKYAGSFIAFGVALSFKLQAIFLFPFLLFIYVYKKKFSFLQFFWIPIMMIVMNIGGLVYGRGLRRILGIYHEQTGDGNMSINYPSLWAMLIENYNGDRAFYSDMQPYAILLTVLILMVIMVMIFRHSDALEQLDLFKVAFLMVYTCVYFLPAMHERYGYLYIMMGLAIIFLDLKMVPFYTVLLILDMLSYANYLFEMTPPWVLMSVVNLLSYTGCAIHILRPVIQNNTLKHTSL